MPGRNLNQGKRKKHFEQPGRELSVRKRETMGGLSTNRTALIAAQKLTDNDRLDICDIYETGTVSMRDLAEKYNVTTSVIHRLIHKLRPRIFIDAQLAHVGAVEEELLLTIQEGIRVARKKLAHKSVTTTQAATVVGILTDKWLLITGRATSRIERVPSLSPDEDRGGDRRSKALTILDEIGGSLKRIADLGESGKDKEGEGRSEHIHGDGLQGPGNEEGDNSRVVSPGMAKGDVEIFSPHDRGSEGSRKDDTSSGGSSDLGTGKESES